MRNRCDGMRDPEWRIVSYLESRIHFPNTLPRTAQFCQDREGDGKS